MNGDKNRYVSILKQKQGEIGAVRDLGGDVWANWNPLFELMTDETESTDICNDVVEKIGSSCKKGAIVFLDFDDLGATNRDISTILKRLAADGLIPIPVATLTSSEEQLNTFREFIAEFGKCVAIRLSFNEVDANICDSVNTLVSALDCELTKSHLFFDLGSVSSDLSTVLPVAFPAVAGQLPRLSEWNTVTVAGTGYPKILEIDRDSHRFIPRTEWQFFNKIKEQFATKVSRLDFADYTISHPELIEFDPRTMQLSPKIIYATTDSWLAYKGRSTKGRGFEQTREMCESLIKQPAFLGFQFSKGDDYIYSRAKGIGGPGNSGTWKRAGINHHITFVAREVSTSL